jgi:pimeloyl-ACP methyl ester carboxylesterase
MQGSNLLIGIMMKKTTDQPQLSNHKTNKDSHGPRPLKQDLLAFSRLGLTAISGVTEIVQTLHHTIVDLAGVKIPGNKSISQLVYGCIHTVNDLMAKQIDHELHEAATDIQGMLASDGREAAICALNGVLGDTLQAQDNPLAIEMGFCYQGQSIQQELLIPLIKEAKGRVLLMVHGLCMNDIQWTRQEHNHGETLAKEHQLLPIYLRYNSGLHISENGQRLAILLEQLYQSTGQACSLNILAHSMGGLVSRSACHYAKIQNYAWLTDLKKLIFLGTPHHGAPLEKGGNLIGQLLNISVYTAPFVPLVNLRSCGITDLRHGNLCDEDWQDQDRFELSSKPRQAIPLPTGVSCYAIATSIEGKPLELTSQLIGDGLVGIDSGLGKHPKAEYQLQFASNHSWIGYNINHMQLLSSHQVYEKLSDWLMH